MSLRSSFTTCPFQSMTVLHTIFPMSAYFRKTLTPCCYLPKQRKCPLYLFYYIRTLRSWGTPTLMTLSTPSNGHFRRSTSQIQLPHDTWGNGNLRCQHWRKANGSMDQNSYYVHHCLYAETHILVQYQDDLCNKRLTRRSWDHRLSSWDHYYLV